MTQMTYRGGPKDGQTQDIPDGIKYINHLTDGVRLPAYSYLVDYEENALTWNGFLPDRTGGLDNKPSES